MKSYIIVTDESGNDCSQGIISLGDIVFNVCYAKDGVRRIAYSTREGKEAAAFRLGFEYAMQLHRKEVKGEEGE